ncbi:MAG: hypothetical protein EA339_07930 [Rhodobacteraceae bacterium]|nr:MAG: hypothetical protein EA339_07930 [Paracoccaceae bacterium]
MPANRPVLDRFSALLRKLALSAGLLVIVTVFAAVFWLARQLDDDARKSSYLMIKSGLNSVVTRNERLAFDHAFSTDVFDAVAAQDLDRINRTIGLSAARSGLIHALTISGGPLQGVLGWSDADNTALGAAEFEVFSRAGHDLATSRGLQRGDRAISSFLALNDKLWVLSASYIHPHDRDAAAGEDAALFVAALRLGSKTASDLRDLFLMSDIEIVLSRPDSRFFQTLPVIAADGQDVGYIIWPAPRPGAVALKKMAVPLASSLLLALALLGVGAFMIERLAQRFERALIAAEAADKMKSEFIASLSHELRTPMNGIVGMLELLQLDDLTPDQRELVSIAYGSAETQVEMIDHLLAFGQIESGHMRLSTGPFNPSDLIHEVVALARPLARDKSLLLELCCRGDADSVLLGDRLAIRQIAVNLVGNALKFTAAGKVIVDLIVTSDLQGYHLCLAVTDSGPGIKQTDLERIFDSFVQVDGSATRKINGVGLGLSISQRLAQEMGGTITVETTLGSGSTFVFEVCLEASLIQSGQHDKAA